MTKPPNGDSAGPVPFKERRRNPRRGRPARPIEALLYPVAGLYRAVMNSRNLCYDSKLVKSTRVACPVVSIGNITAGGTGKTPLTALLMEGFRQRGKKIGLVSRGFGGETKVAARVPADGSSDTAKLYGDEPTWFAARFPESPVVVGAKRVDAARLLLRETPVDLIFADDAFQHRALARDFDVVVLDPTEPAWHYRSLPLGREREGFEALRRAGAVFITKTNLAEESRVNWLRKKIAGAIRGPGMVPMVFEMESHLSGFTSLEDPHRITDAAAFRGQKVLLVSGIGRPHTFAKLVRETARAEVAEHLVFPDHHAYTRGNFEDIEIRALKLGVGAILITEKDAVKMQSFRPRVPTWASRLELKPRSDLGLFYETVDRLLFPRA